MIRPVHTSVFICFVLCLTSACDFEPGNDNNSLVGEWDLSTVQIGLEVGYSAPASADEYGMNIYLNMRDDQSFSIQYTDSTGVRTFSGTWSATTFTLALEYPGGSVASGRYALDNDALQYGSYLSNYRDNSLHFSILYKFQRRKILKDIRIKPII